MESDLKGEAFVFLGGLLRSGTPYGVVATAIEQGGIYGEDRFGRFMQFKPKSSEVAQVLDLVAARRARLTRPDYTWSPSDDDPVGDPLDQYGWPGDKCPDFASLAMSLDKSPLGGVERESPRVSITLGAVLEVLVKNGKEKKPEVVSSLADIKHLIELYLPKVRGLSARSLDATFADAARDLRSAQKESAP